MKAAVKRLLCVFLLTLALSVCFAPAMSVSAEPASDRLSTVNQNIYNFLKDEITQVANGTRTSTEFKLSDPNGLLKWTKEELGVSEILFGGSISPEASYAAREKFAECVDLERIVNSLLADCPYELFWYDKIKGTATVMSRRATNSEIMVTDITFKLAVSDDYASSTYSTDAAKIAEASDALDTAKAIVKKHAAKSDWNKLTAYKDEICDLVSYNYTAAGDPDAAYGNAWQLINVFDNDAGTNVVCEGYSKAFKLLCDLSTFEGQVSCYIVNGFMEGGTGAGGHMWNVVQIDGGTLLADITNCDAGTAGAPDQLFLKVGEKYGDIYAFTAGSTTICYAYDQSEYDLHTDGYLELCPVSEFECDHRWDTALTADDSQGHYYACSLCGDRNGFAGHTLEMAVTKATLTTNGRIVEKCSACGYTASETAVACAKTFTLSTVNYTYNGAVKKPAVTVKDANGKTLVRGTDYTVTYPSGRINPGSYTLTVTMKGNYSGTKKLTFNIKLAAPAVKAANAVGGVKISWNEVVGAAYYRVYKSVYTKDGWSGWKAIKTNYTGTTYTDTTVKSADNFRYTVRAFNGSNSSSFKASNSIKFLATPTVKVANAATGVKITWNKVAGAKSYIVYRSVYSGGKWSGWTRVKTGATGTSYTDTTVKSGATVRYTVKAINGNFTSYIKASSTTKFLAQPTVKVATAANGIKASWSKSAGATGYIVYRRTYANGKWSSWQRIKVTSAVSHTDTTAKTGVYYQYTVRAYSGSYKSSFKNSSSIKR